MARKKTPKTKPVSDTFRICARLVRYCLDDFKQHDELYSVWHPVHIADEVGLSVTKASLAWPTFAEFDEFLCTVRRSQGYTPETEQEAIREQVIRLEALPCPPEDCFSRLLDGESPESIFGPDGGVRRVYSPVHVDYFGVAGEEIKVALNRVSA